MIDSWPELHDEAHRTTGYLGTVGAQNGGADDDRIRDRRLTEADLYDGDPARVGDDGSLGD
jgi:hypothetical protein